MKNNSTLVKKILVLASILILFIIFLKPNLKEKPSLLIHDQKLLPNEVEIDNNKSILRIIESPSDIDGRCGEWRTFKITVTNENNYSIEPLIELTSSPNLKFMYPDEYIIPPDSVKNLTFLVNFYCNNEPNEIPIDFIISGAKQRVTFQSLKW